MTPGKKRRDANNELWEVNLVDILLRHSSKNHTRETIAFFKRRQAVAERLAIFSVWRNYILGRRQKDRHSLTPAMVRGMTDGRVSFTDVLHGRLFVRHLKLPKSWEQYYWGTVSPRALVREREHTLIYAD